MAFATALAMYHIITGGTALPTALYCFVSETESSRKFSGKDCILAASRGVNLRNLSPTRSTGSVEFKLTFARCELTVLHGSSIFCALPLFIFSCTFSIPATAFSLKNQCSSSLAASSTTSLRTCFCLTSLGYAKRSRSLSSRNPTMITRSLFGARHNQMPTTAYKPNDSRRFRTHLQS